MWEPSKVQTVLLAVFGLVILGVGIGMAAKANKQQYSETARVGFNIVVSIVIAAIGMGAITFAAFGKQILQFIGIQTG